LVSITESDISRNGSHLNFELKLLNIKLSNLKIRLSNLDFNYSSFNLYISLLSENSTTRTSVAIAQRNAARTVLTQKVRQMVEFHLCRNPAITTADLIAIHLKPYKPPSLSPAPITISEIKTPHPRVVRLKFREGVTRWWRKPAGIYGLECLQIIRR
ncbi:MAG: hypothetical protein LBK25_05065, partial [Treponema sp.]|nr:hypothetical protein [Treponema sp.]